MPLTLPTLTDLTGPTVTEAQYKLRMADLWAALATAAALTDVRGMKNRLINGCFRIDQTAAGSAADAGYHMDQWYSLTESGNVTIGQQADQEAGSPNSIRMTQPDSGAKRIGIAQAIESLNCRDLRSAAVMLSARIRCSVAQPIRYAILEHTGTADTITRDVVNSWASGAFTPSNFFIAGVNVIACESTTPTANAWTTINLTGTCGASLNNLICMVWTEGTLVQNATLDLGRAQLEAGGVVTPFERRSLDIELQTAQRYFNIMPISLRSRSAGAGHIFSSAVIYPTSMRISPTATYYGSGSTVNVSSSSFIQNNAKGGRFEITATAAGDAYAIDRNYSFDARL